MSSLHNQKKIKIITNVKSQNQLKLLHCNSEFDHQVA